MSRQYSEYNNSTSAYSACNYATLSSYNMGKSGVPVPKGNVSGVYVVPTYSAPGYNTLIHNAQPSCGGYFDIGDAYRSKSGSCNTQFVKKLCQ